MILPRWARWNSACAILLRTMSDKHTGHDYAGDLLNLFVPGQGVAPPKLAGREQDLLALRGLLRRLLSGRAPARDAILYGPRGNGKTVLLGAFEAECRAEGIETLALNASQVNTVDALARQLLQINPDHPDKETANPLTRKVQSARRAVQGEFPTVEVGQASVGIPSVGAVTWEKMSREQLDANLERLVTRRCRDKPLVVTLDEAHTLNIEVGQRLLNLSQQLRKDGASFLLALAGTPDLQEHLNAIHSTFWNRAEKLSIGRLSRYSTEEALVDPLAGRSIQFDKSALAAVVEDSQQYPYFIQLWGEALCQAMVRSGRFHVDAATVEAARPKFDAGRIAYYGDRYWELYKQDLLQVADAIAGVFEGRETVRSARLSDYLVTQTGVETQAAGAQLSQLAKLGYIWQPSGSQVCEPGIPSLMTHVRAEMILDRRAASPDPRRSADG